jgi:hypothetical protein
MCRQDKDAANTGNVSQMVQLRYHEKHVPDQPNSVGAADQEIHSPYCVRKKYILSGVPVSKGRCF